MLSNRARSHPKSNKQAAPAFGAYATADAEAGHPLVGMTKTLILRSTTALGSFSSLVHGCCEKISQAFVFARMAKEMASLTKMCQAPFQNMPSMFGAMQPAPAQSSHTFLSAAQPAMAGFPFWPAMFGMPALCNRSAHGRVTLRGMAKRSRRDGSSSRHGSRRRIHHGLCRGAGSAPEGVRCLFWMGLTAALA